MLTSAYPVGNTEELINGLNDVIEDYRKRHRRLRKANQSYRESITSISHDILTPLTSVKGYAQMLRNPGMPAHFLHYTPRCSTTQAYRPFLKIFIFSLYFP